MKKDTISTSKKILTTFIVILLITLAVFLLKPSQGEKLSQLPEEWVQFSSDLLGFSTEIPNTWQANQFPQRNTIIFGSNIHVYGAYKENEDDFYIVFVRRIQLDENETLEDLFFPKEQYGEDRSRLFNREYAGEYSIYTTYSLEIQEKMMSVFISKDGKNFIRYSVANYMRENPSDAQNRMIERLNRIIKSTKLL